MSHARFFLVIAILLIHSAANAQTPPAIPPIQNPKPDGLVSPVPDAQPKHEFQLLVPDGFGGLKEDPPIADSPADGGGDLPGSPTIDPNSIEPTR